jgi:hypothetical protein
MHKLPNSRITSLTAGTCNNNFQRLRSDMTDMWWVLFAFARANASFLW